MQGRTALNQPGAHGLARMSRPRRLIMILVLVHTHSLPIRSINEFNSYLWPGNLDYALLRGDVPIALIEFQRTTKQSVKDHSNNRWFLPSPNRKGDDNRWLAIDIIRKQSGLPLFIIVWSAKESSIRLKLLERIVYPDDSETPKGLRYKHNEVMKADRMVEIIGGY